MQRESKRLIQRLFTIFLFFIISKLGNAELLEFLYQIPEDAPGVNIQDPRYATVDDSFGFLYVISRDEESGWTILKINQEGKLLKKFDRQLITRLSIPQALVVKDNYMYILDKYEHCLLILKLKNGEVIPEEIIDEIDGKKLLPFDVAVDKRTGKIYVSDKGNNRILKFNKSGDIKAVFPNQGIKSPTYITLTENGNALLCVDEFADKIFKYSVATETPELLPFEYDTQTVKNISGIAIHEEYLYVASQGYRIHILDTNGSYHGCLNTGKGNGKLKFGKIKNIFFDSLGYLYITDEENNCIQKLKLIEDGLKAEFVNLYASYSFKEGYFNSPGDITTDNEGNVYVIDEGNQRIKKFNFDGKFEKSFDFSQYVTSGIHAEGICATNDGIYLGISRLKDKPKGCIIKYNFQGEIIGFAEGSGTPTGGFVSPQAIAVNQNTRNIYIVDGETIRRVIMVDKNFNLIKGKEIYIQAIDIAIDSKNRIYVVDEGDKEVEVYDENLQNLIAKFGGEGEYIGKFLHPCSITIDKEDRVWVADDDIKKRNIQIFENFEYIYELKGNFSLPVACYYDKRFERLYVTDQKNHRILVYGKKQGSSAQEKITLWNCPNPFDPNKQATKIYADFKDETTKKVKIKIFNILGELIWEKEINKTFLKGPYPIADWNDKDAADGVYICLLETDNGKKATCKIVVIKKKEKPQI